MSNSKLVDYVKISPNSTNPRNHKIDRITIHHMAGDLSVEVCGDVFYPTSRQASSNYGIGSDGRVGQYVDEANRSWCSSSRENDNRAITIEVANCSVGGEWPVSDKAYEKLIDLCVDICQRNGIERLDYTGDQTGNLTMHKWFAATCCPGPYLEKRFPDIAARVNERLGVSEPEKAPEKAPVGVEVNLPMLSKGSKGESVEALQTLLIGYGFSCGSYGADGDFGGATDKAVRAYQTAHGLDVDGIVGPATWGQLLGV